MGCLLHPWLMGTAIDQLMKEVDIDTEELEVVKNPLYLISEEGWEQQVDVEKLRADHSLAIKTAMWRAIHDLTNKYYENNAPSSSNASDPPDQSQPPRSQKRKADDDGLDFLTTGSTFARPIERAQQTRPRSAPFLADMEISSYKALCESNKGIMKLELDMNNVPKW
jgi:hypothetical protein